MSLAQAIEKMELNLLNFSIVFNIAHPFPLGADNNNSLTDS